MKPSGAGELYEKFLRLKKKLTDEGLFEEERKKVLPFLPKKIGIVTSGDGAAIHDMMVQISKRMPTVRVLLVDVRVQGPGSAEEIAEGIELLNSRADTDVIIVGRGGGSLEDLWSFNEEVVVRAIAKSEIPVISAVGHEVDISLSDFVADYRAATPTAAAEVVVPDREILLSELDELEDRLNDTDRWFQPLTQALDELEEGLESAIVGLFERIRPKVELLASKLDGIKPRLLIGRGRESLNQLDNRLQFAVNTALSSKLMKLDGLGGRLESVSHKGVMKRGYSLVRAKGKILRDPSKLRVGEQIDVSFYEGAVTATVDKKTES